MSIESRFEHQIESIEFMVHELENSADSAVSSKTRELLQAVMSLHGACLERMLEITRQTGALGQTLIESFANDEKVRNLLLLYDLHPIALETRVQKAIDKIGPYLRSHGASAELLALDEAGAVRVRLEGNGAGCSSSAGGLKSALEQAIYDAAPDVTAIHVEGSFVEQKAAIAFVPLATLLSESAAISAASPAGRGGK